ncbi:MAG: Rieske 2Fe-2S domain-containing protein [Nitrospira sp.]|nr:Rieske 2Fe-2S domain-containing protein [Nitrospira sp.]MDD9859522.1 Rieske 2Fe-2S domain-containing protein [Nitrospira sp.]
MRYIDVAHISEIEPGTCRSFEVEGQCDVALCNVDGEILALQDTCPHAGGPLGEGTLEGNIVQCPWHGWAFDVRTGQCLKNPVPAWSVPCHPTRVENGIIQVAFPPEP